jgi:type I restriction enzyme M protein
MDITQKLWGICHILRHEGVNSSEFIEQLTYVLFLKLADEMNVAIPAECQWTTFAAQPEETILTHWQTALKTLQESTDPLLKEVYKEPISRFYRANTLKRAVQQIDEIAWHSVGTDIIGIAFEELLARVAADGKRGAGQYFTPRPLIDTIVKVVQPDPLETPNFSVCDVANGTSGFLISAHKWAKEKYENKKLTQKQVKKIKEDTYFGQELDIRTRRLALMNLFLHGLAPNVEVKDSIYDQPSEKKYTCILANPPFGTRGAGQHPKRDFIVKTNDKQLNFIQHIIERLEDGGRAGIVLPDSCLSSDAAKKIWAHYLDETKSGANVCNLHTILKLPEGVFAAYANGVKACVVFLEKGKPTENVWIFNARKNAQKITTKSNILTHEYFDEFTAAFGKRANGTSPRKEDERFKKYAIKEVENEKYDLSFVEIFIPEPLPHPAVIIDEMIADYKLKIEKLERMKASLPPYKKENYEFANALG